MPYIEDIEQLDLENQFDVDVSSDNVIWRYVSFEKLLSLVNRRAIHFRQAELLDDEYEGELPPAEHLPDQRIETLYSANSLITHISSWYLGDAESGSLWDEYDADLLIKSDASRLREAIRIDEEYGVQFIEVTYIDWRDTEIGFVSRGDGTWTGNTLDPFEYKRREQFEFESEFRAIATSIGGLSDAEEGEVDFFEMVAEYQQPNIFVDANVDALIDEIRVAPDLGDWVVDEVSTWIDRELGIGERVRYSSFSD